MYSRQSCIIYMNTPHHLRDPQHLDSRPISYPITTILNDHATITGSHSQSKFTMYEAFCTKRMMFSYCLSRDSGSLLRIRVTKEKSLRREVKFSIASASFSEPIWSKLNRRVTQFERALPQYVHFCPSNLVNIDDTQVSCIIMIKIVMSRFWLS